VFGTDGSQGPFHQASLSPAKSHAPSIFTPIDVNTPPHEAAVLRSAILVLAACQRDISRDSSSPEEKVAHATAAQELFRTVYGTKNNLLSSESGNTSTEVNALGLAFTDRARIPSTAKNNVPTSISKQTSGVPTAPASTRILALEDELRLTRTAKSTIEADLAAAKKRQERTDLSIREAETRSRDALRLLESERDEVHILKRRLVETEQKVLEMEQSAAGVESRVWVRLRDMVYEQFGSTRGL
jgi:chromosome segregation ATPase